MVEQQHYMSSGLPHPGDLAGHHHGSTDDRPSAPPTTSAYPDIAPYSAVSSFNLPSQCDSNLLTPISTGGSPPLHQARKLARQYPPPPYSQLPTPPGSSKMYQWNNQFDMNSHVSQAGSPMNTQAPVAPEFYMSDERRTPGPPEPYLGSYGVSEGPDTQPIHAGPPYYLDVSMENHNSIMMRENPPMPMDPHHRDMARNAPPPPAPLLSQPHPAHYRPTRRPSMDHHGHGDANRSHRGSPRRRPTQGNTRVKKSRASKRQPSLRNPALDPADDHQNCFGQEVPPTLKPSCPDEERCIFDSRWNHRDQKGQDMWDSIQAEFTQRFNKDQAKEMLQMKFKRARAKYIHWHEEDKAIARLAWRRVEEERFPSMLKFFLEMGGSRNMYLSASDMELMVVNELKLEESLYIMVEELALRRRRKSVVKKRSARGEPGGEQPVSDELLSVGSHSTHNEDDVINQVYGRRDARWDEDSSSNSEMTDVSMWDSRAPMKMEPGLMVAPGEHMARQACEQLLKGHSNSNLNGHPAIPAGGPPAQQLYHHRKGA